MLEGEKVLLRGLELSDAPILHKYVNDWEVRKFLLHFYPFSLVDEEEFIKSCWDRAKKGSDFVFGIVEKSSGELIGTIGLHKVNWKNRHAELGVTIWRKDKWDQGLGSDAIKVILNYAFGELNLHKVYLRVFDFNIRAIRVYEKIGFKREGVLRDDLWRDGEWHDTIIMSILENEFYQKI